MKLENYQNHAGHMQINIGMHVRVCAEDRRENVMLEGGFHMCDQRRSEKEMLSFVGRMSDVR